MTQMKPGYSVAESAGAELWSACENSTTSGSLNVVLAWNVDRLVELSRNLLVSCKLGSYLENQLNGRSPSDTVLRQVDFPDTTPTYNLAARVQGRDHRAEFGRSRHARYSSSDGIPKKCAVRTGRNRPCGRPRRGNTRFELAYARIRGSSWSRRVHRPRARGVSVSVRFDRSRLHVVETATKIACDRRHRPSGGRTDAFGRITLSLS